MKLSFKILIHTIYWLVFLMFTTMFAKTSKMGVWPSLNDITPHILLNWIWAAAIFYLFYFYFIRYFEQQRFVIYLIYSIASSIVITFLFLPLHKLLFVKFEVFNYLYFAPPMFGTFIIAQCGCLVRGFENWVTNMHLKTELENRNLRNELELLKSQVNPHFLFNTLNNIDSLIRTTPKSASDALINLSDMLRYMIYETTAEKVPLNKEIEYIRKYIKLQSLRYRNTGYVRIELPESCDHILIAPMLMVPFMENAFKYAVDTGKYPVIDLSVKCDKKQFIFTCMNYYKTESVSGQAGGVGLENVRRRLGLLYAGKHRLSINKENDIFAIVLQIELV
jgi:two-component system, LytTR family, sensor kinase